MPNHYKLYSFTTTLNHSICSTRCRILNKCMKSGVPTQKKKISFFHWVNFETRVNIYWKLRWKFSKTKSFNGFFCFQIHYTPEVESFFRNYFNMYLKCINHLNDWYNRISMIPTPFWVFVIFHVWKFFHHHKQVNKWTCE